MNAAADMTPLEIEAAIVAAYGRRLRFPVDWTGEQRTTFISDHAAPVVSWVLDEYDNLVDDWTDWGYRHRVHHEEVAAHISSSRELLLGEALHPQPDELPTPDNSYFE